MLEVSDTGVATKPCWLALGGEIWMDVKSRLTHYGANPFRGNLEAQFDRR
jgi:hypothetical protein